MNLTHVLLAGALLAAPVGVGMASQGDVAGMLGLEDDAPEDELQATDADQQDSDSEEEDSETEEIGNRGGEEIDSFSGEVSEDVTKAVLDLRIDRGAIELVGWEEERYEIAVIQEETEGSSNGETNVEFTDEVDGDTLSIELIVDREGDTGPTIHAGGQTMGEDPDRAIVAFVPQRLNYEDIYACEGEDHDTSAAGVTLFSSRGCVEGSGGAFSGGSISVNANQSDGLDVEFALANLDGEHAELAALNNAITTSQLSFETLKATTNNGAIDSENVSAETATFKSNNGAIHGEDMSTEGLTVKTNNGAIDVDAEAEEALVETNNGAVELSGPIQILDAESNNGKIVVASPVLSEGQIETNNGKIDLTLTPASSGGLDLASNNGAINVHLGHEEDVGYAVHGQTDNGHVEIDLVDQEEETTESDEHDQYRSGEEASAKTENYEDHPIQLAIEAASSNGGIEVTEQMADGSDEAESSQSSTSTTSSGLLDTIADPS